MTSKEIALIDLIVNRDEGVTLTEAIRICGFSKTTVYRTLENLTKMSLLHKNLGKYFPGAIIIRWMNAEQSKRCISRIFDSYLEELVSKFNHTVHLVQLQDNNKGVYIQKLQREGVVQIKSSLGDELALYSTGAGRAMLAEFTDAEILDYFVAIGDMTKFTRKTVIDRSEILKLIQEYRAAGFATEIEQNEQGIQCVGVAFRYGGMMLAISVVTTTLEPVEVLEAIGSELVTTKNKILNDMK